MIMKQGQDPATPALTGPLDVVAYAGREGFGAASVAVAVGQFPVLCDEDTEATVRGWCSSAGCAPPGRLLVLASEIPVGTVKSVDVEDQPDGSVRLSAAELGHSGHPRWTRGSAQLLRARTVDQLEIAILVDGATRAPRDGAARSFAVLLDAVAKAVHAERGSLQQRLRFGLQEREEERRRWARELHDETLQQLGALQVLLTSVMHSAETAAEGPDVLLAGLPTATEMLNRQIEGLRHLITELRPATLDELGLSAPLQALARRTEDLTGLSVQVHVSLRYAAGQVSTRLLPDIEVAVYRVVQEAVTNACRHSGGSHVGVSVVEDDQEVHVEIRDNGKGIPAGTDARGFGIIGMQERAALAGGRLEVLSGHGDSSTSTHPGTVIRLVVPATHRRAQQRSSTTETGEQGVSEVTSSAVGPRPLVGGTPEADRDKRFEPSAPTHAKAASPDPQKGQTGPTVPPQAPSSHGDGVDEVPARKRVDPHDRDGYTDVRRHQARQLDADTNGRVLADGKGEFR